MKYIYNSPLSGNPDFYLNHTRRFYNATEMVKYVCSTTKPNIFTEWLQSPESISARPDSYHDNYNYEPICPFPYLPKGWAYNSNILNATNVELNTCSLTWAEAAGDQYSKKCQTYFIMSMIPGIIFLFYLALLANSKNNHKAMSKEFFILPGNLLISKKPNLSEKICWLNVLVSVLHCFVCTDIEGWYGTITLPWRSVLIGFFTAIYLHIVVILVSGWVTVIDGGKVSELKKSGAQSLPRKC